MKNEEMKKAAQAHAEIALNHAEKALRLGQDFEALTEIADGK